VNNNIKRVHSLVLPPVVTKIGVPNTYSQQETKKNKKTSESQKKTHKAQNKTKKQTGSM